MSDLTEVGELLLQIPGVRKHYDTTGSLYAAVRLHLAESMGPGELSPVVQRHYNQMVQELERLRPELECSIPEHSL